MSVKKDDRGTVLLSSFSPHFVPRIPGNRCNGELTDNKHLSPQVIRTWYVLMACRLSFCSRLSHLHGSKRNALESKFVSKVVTGTVPLTTSIHFFHAFRYILGDAVCGKYIAVRVIRIIVPVAVYADVKTFDILICIRIQAAVEIIEGTGHAQ